MKWKINTSKNIHWKVKKKKNLIARKRALWTSLNRMDIWGKTRLLYYMQLNLKDSTVIKTHQCILKTVRGGNTLMRSACLLVPPWVITRTPLHCVGATDVSSSTWIYIEFQTFITSVLPNTFAVSISPHGHFFQNLAMPHTQKAELHFTL